MASFKYKDFSETKFEIVGRDEVVVATVERSDDNVWRILPKPHWKAHDEFNFGPFGSSEEAFEELDAVQAEQS